MPNAGEERGALGATEEPAMSRHLSEARPALVYQQDAYASLFPDAGLWNTRQMVADGKAIERVVLCGGPVVLVHVQRSIQSNQ